MTTMERLRGLFSCRLGRSGVWAPFDKGGPITVTEAAARAFDAGGLANRGLILYSPDSNGEASLSLTASGRAYFVTERKAGR